MALPGVQTVINDRFYTLSRTDIPVGPRVVALGRRTTADGSSGVSDLDPYNASNENAVITAFGAGSDLHRAYLELAAGGAQRITLVALPSDTVFDHAAATLSSVNYTAAGGADLLGDVFAAAESVRADIIIPWGRGSGSTDYDDHATPATPGFDELGFHADNTSVGANSWAKKIADVCAQITADSHPVFAVLGVKPWQGNSDSAGGMTPANVASHLNLTDLTDRETQLGNNGIYVSVVACELEPLGYNNNYDFGFANGATSYAAHIAQLDSWSAPTSKPIFNVSKLRYNPTRTQQQAQIDKGVVPVALNFNRTPTWIDAQTFGKATSDYIRLTTLRIVFDSVLMVRQVTQQFIGEGATQEARNAIDTAITAGLRGMQQLGAVLSSDFTVTYVPAENKAIIDLVLRPAFELRIIEVSVSVQI